MNDKEFYEMLTHYYQEWMNHLKNFGCCSLCMLSIFPVVSSLFLPLFYWSCVKCKLPESAYRIWDVPLLRVGGKARALCETKHHHHTLCIRNFGSFSNRKCKPMLVFLSVLLAPPSCGNLSREGGYCPERPQWISWHDRCRGSIPQGVGLAYLCHQCWARRSHKQRWKNKNR